LVFFNLNRFFFTVWFFQFFLLLFSRFNWFFSFLTYPYSRDRMKTFYIIWFMTLLLYYLKQGF
jgi:hypothetical protein